MSKSYFFYIHPDLTKVPDVWKLGITKTPYSAVRARQKYCWEQVGLTHLYFGLPFSISLLESNLKKRLGYLSGKSLQQFGTQTEMFKIDINTLLLEIDSIIVEKELYIKKVDLPTPYTAVNAGQCPFGICSEDFADNWARNKAIEIFGTNAEKQDQSKVSSIVMYDELFATMYEES